MTDIIDKANDVAAVAVEARISESQGAKPEAEATGHCLNCGAKLRRGKRWCDADCRDDWQAMRNRKAGRLG